MAIFKETGEWKLSAATVPFSDEANNMTPKVELQESIEKLLTEFTNKETAENG